MAAVTAPAWLQIGTSFYPLTSGDSRPLALLTSVSLDPSLVPQDFQCTGHPSVIGCIWPYILLPSTGLPTLPALEVRCGHQFVLAKTMRADAMCHLWVEV